MIPRIATEDARKRFKKEKQTNNIKSNQLTSTFPLVFFKFNTVRTRKSKTEAVLQRRSMLKLGVICKFMKRYGKCFMS